MLEPALAGARRIFDVDADAPSIDAVLADDPRLRPLVEEIPGLRVPGAIDGFEMAVRAIVGQQISVAARADAHGAARRDRSGSRSPTTSARCASPSRAREAVAASTLEGLGMPASRSATLSRAGARAICDGELDLSPGADREATRAALLAIRGVGPWTADYVAMRGLGDPDAFLPSDLVIRQVLGDAAGPRQRARGRAAVAALAARGARTPWRTCGRRRRPCAWPGPPHDDRRAGCSSRSSGR